MDLNHHRRRHTWPLKTHGLKLKDWDTDLAIVGRVKKPDKSLSLWFVSCLGESTLDRGDRPYELESATLGKDFHEDFTRHDRYQGIDGSGSACNH